MTWADDTQKIMYKMQSTEKRKQMLMVMNYIQIYHCFSNKTPVNQKKKKSTNLHFLLQIKP